MTKNHSYVVLKVLTLLFLFNFKIQAHIQFDQDDSQAVNHTNVTAVVEKFMLENADNLISSTDRDIVVFIGNTGSGKSTLINYLNEKPLTVTTTGTIVLSDPSDLTAMEIGTGSESQTLLPKYISYNSTETFFYDLPGIGDTRGTAVSLVNGCIIKSIIEKAKTVRIVFVAGQDEVTAERGKLFKVFYNSAISHLIPNQNIEDISSLVITKSRVGFNNDQLIARLKEATIPNVLDLWIKKNRLTHMSDTHDGKINQNDKAEILQVIKTMSGQKINDVNISEIYNNQEKAEIAAIYNIEIENIFNRLISQSIDISTISLLNTQDLDNKKNYFNNIFFNDLELSLNQSKLITLLRPCFEDLYLFCWNKVRHNNQIKIDNILEKMKVREANIAQQEAEEKAHANNPANWPAQIETKVEPLTYWSTKYLGNWEEYRGGSGISRRTKHQRPELQDEMTTQVTYQQIIRVKPNTNEAVVEQSWREISRTEGQKTGKINRTGNFAK